MPIALYIIASFPMSIGEQQQAGKVEQRTPSFLLIGERGEILLLYAAVRLLEEVLCQLLVFLASRFIFYPAFHS